MFKRTVEFLGLTLLTIALTACGGGGGSEGSSSVQTALSGSSEENTLTQKDVPLPKEEVLKPVIDLDRALASDNAATAISHSVMKGITPYATKSMWGSSAVSHYSAQTKHYYVAPMCTGTEAAGVICGEATNKGTKESPWDFYGVTQGQHDIEPDSVVWMEAGEYSNPNNTATENYPFQIKISGTTNKPIHFRAEDGNFDAVKVNAGINVAGNWVWIWDIEMTYIRQIGEENRYDKDGNIVDDWRPHNTSLPYYFNTSGYEAINASGNRLEVNFSEKVNHSKVINTRAHKLGEGISAWSVALNVEIYGNIIYDNGWTDLDRGHGHGLYQQNSTGTTRLISDNIVAGDMGHALQIYSTQVSKTNDFSVIGNIFFAARETDDGNGIYIATSKSKNIKFNENYVSAYALRYPYIIATDEIYLNGSKFDENGNRVYQSPLDRECSNNVFYAAYASEDWDCDEDTSNIQYNYYGNYLLNEVKSYIRPNKYDGRRANLVVINPNKEDVVSIDLGAFVKKGDKVMIFNSLDMSTPLEYGTYNGTYANIHWPDTSWSLVRYVDHPDSEIKKEFWAFVIINLGQ